MSPVSASRRAELEEIADRIWEDASREARARIRRDLYGGRLLDAPVALVLGSVKASRDVARMVRALVISLISLLQLAVAILAVAVAAYLAWQLWLLAKPAAYLLAVAAGLAGIAYIRR